MKVDASHKSRSPRAVAVIAAVLAASLLAACGSSSNKSESAAASSATKAPVVIGTIGTFTGPYASAFTDAPPTLKAWVQWTNAHGGINGHPVELIVKDDGGDPGSALAAVKEMVERDKVVALVGDQDAFADAAYSDYISSVKVPVIGGTTTTAPWSTNPLYFAPNGDLIAVALATVHFLKQAGVSEFGVSYCAEAPNCAKVVDLVKPLAEKEGMHITFAQAISASAPDFTAPCLAAKQAGVEGQYIAVASAVAIRYMESCGRQGFTPRWIFSSAGIHASDLTHKELEGAIITNFNFPTIVDDPATKDFHEAMRKYAPDAPLSDISAETWVAGQLFAKAAAKVGDHPTAAEILAGLYALKDETLGGLAPRALNFAPGRPSTPVSCMYRTLVRGGKQVAPDGIKATCLAR